VTQDAHKGCGPNQATYAGDPFGHMEIGLISHDCGPAGGASAAWDVPRSGAGREIAGAVCWQSRSRVLPIWRRLNAAVTKSGVFAAQRKATATSQKQAGSLGSIAAAPRGHR
jgi:hypothetical protein